MAVCESRRSVARRSLTVLLFTILLSATVASVLPVTAAIGVSVSIVIVFAAVHGIEWMLERRTAKLLTEQLAAFQKRNSC